MYYVYIYAYIYHTYIYMYVFIILKYLYWTELTYSKFLEIFKYRDFWVRLLHLSRIHTNTYTHTHTYIYIYMQDLYT